MPQENSITVLDLQKSLFDSDSSLDRSDRSDQPVRPVGPCRTGHSASTGQTIRSDRLDRLIPILAVNSSLEQCDMHDGPQAHPNTRDRVLAIIQ